MKDTKKWNKIDFRGLSKKLVYLKFKCLHVKKYGRKHIDVSCDDIMQKHNSMGTKFKRGSYGQRRTK